MTFYTETDDAAGVTPPDCLKDEAYTQMSEDGIDPDYMCDREAQYIASILEKGPWLIKEKVSK